MTATLALAPPSGAYASKRGLMSWALFDWAAQPHATLLTTFVFAPFFASALASSPAWGQTLWAYATAVTGLFIAALSPLLGAIADGTGERKRWIFAFLMIFVVGAGSLWFAIPGAPYAVAIALIGYSLANIGFEFATTFNNAMMPSLVPPHKMGRLSGYAWAFGYVGGLVSLVLVLGLMAAAPDTGRTMLGLKPIFGLDPALREGDRASGPLSALWFLVFCLPMFLFTPDSRRGLPLKAAVETGLGSLRTTLKNARQNSTVFRFLIANMVYIDGLNALYAFGGIYAAGVFGWTIIELGVFGILLNVTAVAGAALGGWYDDRIGPKKVIAFSLVLLVLLCAAMLSLTPHSVFFVFDVVPPKPDGGLFASAAERWCLVIGGLIGAVGGPLQAASRTMLIRLVPKEKIGEYFGLLALSGKATSFIAPFIIGTATLITHDQRSGLAVLVVFFALGHWLLRPVSTSGQAQVPQKV